MERPEVKICGLTRRVDAEVAEASGASYVGAIFVPGTPREVLPETAASLAESVRIPLIAVVADLRATEIGRIARRAGAKGIQLHGSEPPHLIQALRGEGEWELWKAIRVRSERDILDACHRFGELVDLLLFDGWQAGRLGGTGTPFPWDTLGSVREEIPSHVRVGVAGGLFPGNVREAALRLDPDLVDVSSGVESAPGIKDPQRVKDFVEKAVDPERHIPRA